MSNPSNDEIISRVNRSPRWSSTTKLVVGLTLVAVSAAMIIRFKELIDRLSLQLRWLTCFTRWPVFCIPACMFRGNSRLY